jgi:hypothetical protein
MEAAVQNPFSALGRWWRNWTATYGGTLNSCDDEDVARMARDVGVSATELRSLAGKWPDSADLLNRRLAALDLDPADVRRAQSGVLSDLQRVCTLCLNGQECRHDLERDPSDPGWREYCPNVMTLDALDAERVRNAGRDGSPADPSSAVAASPKPEKLV